MRPMPIASDPVTGAFTPRDWTHVFIDVKLANTPKTTVTVPRAQVAGYGTMPGYGTYIEIAKTKYDTHRFYNTAPVPTLTLRPQLNNPAKTVTSPGVLLKQPGYTSQLPYATTPLGQLVNKPYLGAPPM